MTPRCAHCPVALGKRCHALRAVCDAVLGHPERAANVVRLADEIEAAQAEAVVYPSETATPRSVAETAALIRRARSCPHLIPPECGCAWGDCRKLGRWISHLDCFDCPDLPTDPPPPETGPLDQSR